MTAFTNADVQLVAEALLRDYPRPDRALAERFDTEARAVLAALADAGRLTPDGAALREQWKVQYFDKAFEERHAEFHDTRREVDEALAMVRASPRFSEVKVLYKISTAWVAADGTP